MSKENITYYAKIIRIENGYRVTFPDLPGVNAYGINRDEALRSAREVLQNDLEFGLSNQTIPTKYDGEEYYPIVVKKPDEHRSLEDTRTIAPN